MAQSAQQACIVGVGETKYAKRGEIMDRSELQLAAEAMIKACADAGIDPQEIDGMCSYANDRNEPELLQDSLGLPNVGLTSMVWGGGGVGTGAAIQHAAMAVESGRAKYVIVLRAICQGQFARFGQFRATVPNVNFMAPFGMLSPPGMLSLIVRRYMHEYGIKNEHLGHVAITFRDYASRNPRAVMGNRPLTMETYMAARMVADPFRLFDCTQENDGACAMLVTTAERARDLRQKAVRILASVHINDPGVGPGGHGPSPNDIPLETFAWGTGFTAAEKLYAMAGLKPSDMDVLAIYDHFTGMVLLTLENFGICGRGEAGDYVAAGNLGPGGKIPANTAGGHLSEAYLQGLNNAIEGVRQLRGQSTSQVKDAKLCLVTGGSGGPAMGAAILGV